MPSVPRRTVGTVLTNDLRGVTLDATLSDEAGVEVSWSSHPIEDGSEIQDHGTIGPRTYSLVGKITRTTFAGDNADDPRRLETLRDAIFQMAADRLPCLVVYDTYVLEDYVITSVATSRDQSTGQALGVSIGLQELVTTTAKTTEIPAAAVAPAQAAGMTTPGDGGQQVPADTEGTEVKEEVSTSIAASGFNFLVGG